MSAFQLLHSSYRGLGFLSGFLGTHVSQSSPAMISSFFCNLSKESSDLFSARLCRWWHFSCSKPQNFSVLVLEGYWLGGEEGDVKKNPDAISWERKVITHWIEIEFLWLCTFSWPTFPLDAFGWTLLSQHLLFTAWIPFWKHQSSFL